MKKNMSDQKGQRKIHILILLMRFLIMMTMMIKKILRKSKLNKIGLILKKMMMTRRVTMIRIQVIKNPKKSLKL